VRPLTVMGHLSSKKEDIRPVATPK
jgi:hypothetical protein